MTPDVAGAVVDLLLTCIRDENEVLSGLAVSMWSGLADLEHELGSGAFDKA
jgi:hypothetical protein